MRIGIIGMGTVGRAISNGFREAHEIFVHDPILGSDITTVTENTDLAYIAVPTPSRKDSGACDTRFVEEVLSSLPDGFSAVIKSTVIPGTTQRLHEQFPGLKIACSPEFLRSETSDEDFQDQQILVVGTHHKDLAEEVFDNHLQAGVIGGNALYHITPTQAEIVKYVKNSFYALKVIFGNQFQEYCENIGEDWGMIKEIVTKPQNQVIGPSHLGKKNNGEMGFGGECLPKDVKALVYDLESRGIDFELLRAVLNDNDRLRDGN
mgnify:CR=1 FL=1